MSQKIRVIAAAGNLIDAANFVNEHGMADHVLQFVPVSMHITQIVLRMDSATYEYFKKKGVM